MHGLKKSFATVHTPVATLGSIFRGNLSFGPKLDVNINNLVPAAGYFLRKIVFGSTDAKTEWVFS